MNSLGYASEHNRPYVWRINLLDYTKSILEHTAILFSFVGFFPKLVPSTSSGQALSVVEGLARQMEGRQAWEKVIPKAFGFEDATQSEVSSEA